MNAESDNPIGPLTSGMKRLFHAVLKLVLATLLAALVPGSGRAQSAAPSEISQVKVLLTQGSPAFEITSTRQVIPTITQLGAPLRLVIDLPNSNLSVRRKRMEIHGQEITAVRLEQYAMTPPVAQIVVNLAKPHRYTWEAAGNRLIVRLQPDREKDSEDATAASTPFLAPETEVKPAVVALSLSTATRVVLADSLASGASLSQNSEPTILRLTGGEIHICPHTMVSIVRSSDRHEMMLGMSTGALETNYALANSADSIVTPDVRILLRGPGEFHYAINSDLHGNACVVALPGSTGSAIVSELIGDGIREVKPGEQLVLHSGRFDAVSTSSADTCGCPESIRRMRASLSTGSQSPSSAVPQPAKSGEGSKAVVQDLADTAPLPVLRRDEIHVTVEVPLVFPDRSQPADKSVPSAEAKNLPSVEAAPVTAVVSKPGVDQTEGKPSRSKFFGRIRGLMVGMFR